MKNPAKTQTQPKSWEEIARKLYVALDDIDTADDLAKGNEKFYRERVRHLCRVRHDFMDTGGWPKPHRKGDTPPADFGTCGGIGPSAPARELTDMTRSMGSAPARRTMGSAPARPSGEDVE